MINSQEKISLQFTKKIPVNLSIIVGERCGCQGPVLHLPLFPLHSLAKGKHKGEF